MAYAFTILVWMGAALMTMVALQQWRPTLGTLTAWTAALLVGQAVGYAVTLAVAPRTWLDSAPDMLIGLALAAWLILRPGTIAFVIVIVFELLAAIGAVALLATRPHAAGIAVGATLAWRLLIVAMAATALIRRPPRVA